MHHSKYLIPTVSLGIAVASGLANAQTWTANGNTPRILDIFEVDPTGEPSWPFGSEDVAGDGQGAFLAAEQAHDLRSGYVDTGDGQLWFRSYVSSATEPPGTLTLLLFVDSDSDASTGGPAMGAEIDPRLTDDPSPGGYEHVVIAPATDNNPTLWDWSQADGSYVEVSLTASEASVDRGEDVDPLVIGAATRGYVQLSIDLSLLGATNSCGVDLFARSLSDALDVTDGDLELGDKSTCIASDTNSDGVPDPYVPPDCSSNNGCPLNGICVNGECILPQGCETTANCATGEVCTAAGRCVAAGGDSCQAPEDCDDLLCENGECVACSPGSAECGPGFLCGPSGRCVETSQTAGSAGSPGSDGSAGGTANTQAGSTGIQLQAGEKISGGAFRCSVQGSRQPNKLSLAGLMTFALLLMRRRARRRA